MLGWEVMEGQQFLAILDQAFGGLEAAGFQGKQDRTPTLGAFV